jgi:very-short-patch-repair endonuclease
LYHLWSDVEFRHSDGLVTEADLFFPDERVAVFSDGGHHARAKQKGKDAAITEKLAALGIRSIRIPGDEIREDLPKAIARVKEVLVK